MNVSTKQEGEITEDETAHDSQKESGEEPEDESHEEVGEDTQEEPKKETKPKRKRFFSRRNKVLIVVAIVAIALIVVLWGAAPPDYDEVRDIVKNRGKYLGDEVTVKGKVGNWTGGKNFTLVDDKNASFAIFVVHEKAMPEGFAEGKVVVVEGKLEEGEFGLTIISTKIQVGCPSKY
ncbi:MAG: cytochrome c maturation protein CcmE [Thermoplasmata archaeon]|nr:MAG: cytochrome c maturation protein CcmE [Thermoplasmata archaeon]